MVLEYLLSAGISKDISKIFFFFWNIAVFEIAIMRDLLLVYDESTTPTFQKYLNRGRKKFLCTINCIVILKMTFLLVTISVVNFF